MTNTQKCFTPEEDEFVINNYRKLTYEGLAKALNRSRRSVEKRIIKLRKMRPGMLEAQHCYRFNRLHIGSTRVKRRKTGKSSGKSHFNKRVFILVSKKPNEWKLYHHYIWEQHYGVGSIPKQGLCFKNGDYLDVKIENLIPNLTTTNDKTYGVCPPAKRNSHLLSDGWVAYAMAPKDKVLREELLKHPELIELKRQQIRLDRALKE